MKYPLIILITFTLGFYLGFDLTAFQYGKAWDTTYEMLYKADITNTIQRVALAKRQTVRIRNSPWIVESEPVVRYVNTPVPMCLNIDDVTVKSGRICPK